MRIISGVQTAWRTSEARFRSNVELAYDHLVRYGTLPVNLKESVFPVYMMLKRPADHMEFLTGFYANVAPRLSKFTIDFSYIQAFEAIKNAASHGGDALLAINRHGSLLLNASRPRTEVIVWDNGPGIKDIMKALAPGFSTDPDQFSDFSGMGKGMDLIIGEKPTRYAAQQMIIESGFNKVSRMGTSAPYREERLLKPVPGTRVTMRFVNT
ncbi:MAG TPA: hypothetical protein VMD02_07515 [Candidatus Omnitrophota bacterium]|nr:hypothetical protein [Candidatus Omnitrophota bacterium]